MRAGIPISIEYVFFSDLEYVGMSLPSSGGLSLSMMLGLWDDFTLSGDDLLPVVHEQTKNNMSLREVRSSRSTVGVV